MVDLEVSAIGGTLPQYLPLDIRRIDRKANAIPRKSQSIARGKRTPVDLAIEACWLFVLAAVPLAFNGRDVVVLYTQPKDFVMHFAALSLVSLWVLEWALGWYRPPVDLSSWNSFRGWLGWNPRNWALTAAAGFGAVVIISTILSPLPAVSLWGRDFSALGYELYSVMSLLVIFFAIATRVNHPAQVRRILWTVAGAGAVVGLYGVSQRYGWDPIGTGADDARVLSSFGNPIFFGSYLAMSAVITLGLAIDQARNNARGWLLFVSVLVGIQFTALWFTGSRGPWVGVAFGIGAFVLLGAMSFSRRQMVHGASVLVAGFLIAVLLTNLVGSSDDGQTRGVGSIVSSVTPAGGGIGTRSDIWRASARLLDSWENPQQESGALSALRPIFGLGPEMYYYSFPLVADPQNGVQVVSHAHDWLLQLLLEYGFAGVLTFTTLALSVLIVGLMFMWRRRRGNDPNADWPSIAMLTVIASLIGRAVEQSVGIARISDLLLFWALLAVVLAIYRIDRGVGSGIRSGVRARSSGMPLAFAGLVVVAAVGIFVVRDVQMMRAGVLSGDAFSEARAGNGAEAVTLLTRAVGIAPDVQIYRTIAGELLIDKARAEETNEAAMPILAEAYETLLPFEKRDPFAYITQLRIGATEAEMVNRGDSTLRDDLVRRSIRIADSMPAYPAIQAVAAERALIAGEIELGLLFANRAISMETETSPQPLAWLKRGQALAELGETEGALESFTVGLERAQSSPIAVGFHRNLAEVYDALGDPGLATEHRALAEALDASQ